MNAVLNSHTVKELLFPVFEKHGIQKAILFGSVAVGTNNANSDVDILVDSGLKGLRFIGLIEDVKAAMDAEVDLIDVTHIQKGSKVEAEIASKGVIIYEKP